MKRPTKAQIGSCAYRWQDHEFVKRSRQPAHHATEQHESRHIDNQLRGRSGGRAIRRASTSTLMTP